MLATLLLWTTFGSPCSSYKTLLRENLMEGEELPAWAEPTTTSDFNGRAWELKHKQMASRLTRNRYTTSPVPAEGFWSATDTDILIGVASVRDVLRGREVQDHWINRASTYGSGKVLCLKRSVVVASIQRTSPTWRLPVPPLKRVGELLRRK